MRFRFSLVPLLLSAASFIVLGHTQPAHAGDYRIEAQLIWGTTNSTATNQPVEAAVDKKLKDLPLRWSHYYMMNKKVLSLSPSKRLHQRLSPKCEVEIADLGKGKFEVVLFGKGDQIMKSTQTLPTGEILLLGGNAPNSTCWLVALKRLE